MIVCVAPTSNHFDDTHNTLLYADRASKIRTKVVTRNVVNVDRHVGQYVEAINRLNLEVSELKAKLAGKAGNEAEISQRRKEQAKAEVDRARDDIVRKADQTQSSIIAGACCEANTTVARSKLQAYTVRLTQLKAKLAAGSSTPDLIAEQTMLETLINSENSQLLPNSDLQTQLLRSQNASSMFDATLRAVTERRSDRLDDVSVENVRLDAQYRKSQMDRLKAEAQRDALQSALSSQTELVVNLIGVITRCTVMLEDGSKTLQEAALGGPEALVEKSGPVSASLHRVADSNNATLNTLFGRSIDSSFSTGSSLLAFGGHMSTISPSFGSHVPSSQAQAPVKPARRVSSVNIGVPDIPVRRIHRSPRKSSRASLAPGGLFSRRSSLKPMEKKKGVQWKDEAGQGSLDDGGSGSGSGPSSSAMPIDPRPNSPRVSECDWEDEKTDDSASVSFSFSGLPARDAPTMKTGTRRSSRLDPSFLKSRAGPSSLGSLAEDDESKATDPVRRSNPFMNRLSNLPTPPDSSGASSSSTRGLQIPKRTARDVSPSRRAGSALKPPGSAAKKARRQSNIGPLRSEKTRRRSSLLPPPPALAATNPGGESSSAPVKTGPRRVPIVHTPSKRPKRMSLLGGRTPMSTRSSLFSRPSFNLPSDPNGSGEMSTRGTKPTWR